MGCCRGFRNKVGSRGVRGGSGGGRGSFEAGLLTPWALCSGRSLVRGVVVIEGYPRPLPTGCPQGADTPQHLPALQVPGSGWGGVGAAPSAVSELRGPGCKELEFALRMFPISPSFILNARDARGKALE